MHKYTVHGWLGQIVQLGEKKKKKKIRKRSPGFSGKRWIQTGTLSYSLLAISMKLGFVTYFWALPSTSFIGITIDLKYFFSMRVKPYTKRIVMKCWWVILNLKSNHIVSTPPLLLFLYLNVLVPLCKCHIISLVALACDSAFTHGFSCIFFFFLLIKFWFNCRKPP